MPAVHCVPADTHVLVYPGYFSNSERNSERRNSINEQKPLPMMVRNETVEKQPKKKDRPRSVVGVGEAAAAGASEAADGGAGTMSGSAARPVGNEDMAAFQHRLHHMGQCKGMDVCACMCASARACVFVCLCACVDVYTYIYVQGDVHAATAGCTAR